MSKQNSTQMSLNYWSGRWSTNDAPWTRQDIHEFYERGFRVVGVEFVASVAHRFFTAHGLPVVEGRCPVAGCKILHTPDLKLSIYICDLYAFSRECAGAMDIVWDRGGLVSVAEDDRRRYIALMKSVLARDFSYALYATEYDDADFSGFPRNLPLPLIRRLYGEDYQITQLGVTFIERSYVKNKIIRETLWHLKKGSTC
ncbi:putative thiopurine S-methyltransferase isoform X2 [Amblyomma americanum]